MPICCDLVLPCRDEAAALAGVLESVPDDFRVIVVDNGSTDDTAVVGRRLGALVVHERRAGYGAAVHAGVLAATAPYVAVMDGDGSMDGRDLTSLLDEVESGLATMSVGVRQPSMRGAWPWHARIGNTIVLSWVRRRTGMKLRDIAPMRVCRRQALLDLDLVDRRFGYPLELLIRAHEAGWSIVEHPIAYGRRAQGTKSKVSGSVRGSLRTAKDFAQVLR
jgi:glycosyltransferase involved in cell wall biosynthesis